MNFSVKDDNFYLNDRKVFLTSGEIHYFRIKHELWDTHLAAAREAGLTTISTYVPWAWHEYEEGVFDFHGTSCPERDLNSWVEKCSEFGLNCILKPGPFILAEFRGAGLPDWFMEKHGSDVKMHNSHGGIVPSDGVSLFHPVYLEKVKLWYDQIMPFISQRQASAGGNVIMMQVCNEIGVFSWLAHQADYNEEVRERFIRFVAAKYSNISALNAIWETNFSNFSEIHLPPDGRQPYTSKADRARDFDWHFFWRRYYGDYLRMLTDMVRERGVTVPLYHNLPGWIYGNGYEFPVNITMYEDLFEDRSDIIFGVDHIPEFFSYRNLHDDRIINDITYAMQGNKPLFAAEFQSGSREHHVETNPREMELFYKASVANGLRGWNYYMFSQGLNVSRKGYSGDTFYWFNPLTASGERTSAFPLVQRMNKIIRTAENLIVNSTRRAEVCVLFYPPYYASELERPVGKECELVFTAASIRRPAYFDGLLKILQILNTDYDMQDLNKATTEILSKYKQVWAFSTDEMNAREQQTLVDYTVSGGNLVIFPYLPDREISQKPCTILRDNIGIAPTGIETIDSPLVDIYGLNDIKCANPQSVFDDEILKGAEIIARTIRGTACGFSKKIGKGSVIHLGTWIGFDTEGHKPVYEAILNHSGAVLRNAVSNNYHISVRERFTETNSAVLFAGNYYNEEHNAAIRYTHPETGEQIPLPFTQPQMLWPALYGILTPVCMRISEGLKILHSTSDILRIVKSGEDFLFTVYGDRDMPGELVFEGPGLKKILSASINENELRTIRDEKRLAFIYNHLHKDEQIICLKLHKNDI